MSFTDTQRISREYAMPFHKSNIEDICNEIRQRQSWVGRLSLVEFDDEEYDVLTHISREIVRYYENWWSSKQKAARIVFLAFSVEYVRRTPYVWDKFWDEFKITLLVDQSKYKLITENILWRVYEEESINRKIVGGDRQFVDSLLEEVNISNATCKASIEFFHWYYQRAVESRITADLIQQYEDKTGKKLDIHDKAIEALNRDCQQLIKIIEYAKEHELFLAHSDIATYRFLIIEALGKEYDPFRLRILHDKETLRRIIIQLENYRTPRQFLRELEYNPTQLVRPPNSYGTIPRRQLGVDTMVYGLYKLGDVDYNVVPLVWLRIETIAQWQYEKIFSLRNGNYVGYKKKQPFLVKIGTKSIKARECFLKVKDQPCYIWVGKVPFGEPILIDSQPYHGSAGINWETSLELGFNEDGEPRMVIVFNWLKAFYPDARGARLFICSSQGDEVSKYFLDHAQGKCQLYRAFSFPFKQLGDPITIRIDLEEKQLSSRTMESEAAYLFSASTRVRIPNGTKREWGEQSYFLFAPTNVEIIVGEGVTYEGNSSIYDNYTIYQLTWEKTNYPFTLQVGDVFWSFENHRYFNLRIKQQPAEGLIHLTGQQIHRFTQEQIEIWTNRNLTSLSVTCYLLYMDDQVEIKGSFQHHERDQYSFTNTFIANLNELTIEQGCYGHFDLLFYEEEQLLGQMAIVVVPEIKVSFPSSSRPLLEEGKTSPIKISSPHLKIWDIKAGKNVFSADFPLCPALEVQPWKDEVKVPKGILCLTPSIMSIPVTFPAIGETIQVQLSPLVFGFRLYQRTGQGGNYRPVNAFDYYALERSILYVHTKADSFVELCIDETMLWAERADEDGNLLIKKLDEILDSLNKYSDQEQTAVNIHSDGVKSTFLVDWKPLIHEMSIEKNRAYLDVSGPFNTGIVLSLIDVKNNVLMQERIACRGEHLTAYMDFSLAVSVASQSYLVAQYYLSDGTVLPSAWQYRLEAPKGNSLPADWLRAGVGISSEILLQSFVLE